MLPDVPRPLPTALACCALALFACGDGDGTLGSGALRINEVVTDNKSAFVDSLGESDDYVEIVNADDEPIRLAGFTLEDGSGTRGRLPDQVLAPGEVLVLFADAAKDQGPLHLPFRLSSGGDKLVLRSGLREWDRVEIPALGPDVALMRLPHAKGPLKSCNRPSPGRANGDQCEP